MDKVVLGATEVVADVPDRATLATRPALPGSALSGRWLVGSS
jgi:hypothetical protein